MRRIHLLGVAAAGMSLILSACGSANSGGSGSSNVSQSASQMDNSNESSDPVMSADESTTVDVSAEGDSSGTGTSSDNDNDVAAAAGTITTNGGTEIALSDLEHATGDSEASVVYFANEITPTALTKVYEALEWTPEGKVAVKLSTGEPPASNYLQPDLIADLVHEVDGTIVECMTAYGGQRSSIASAKQVAEDHGYTAIADFDLMDEEGDISLPVEGGTRLTEALIGSHVQNYGSVLVLSHFKGHAMAGFGGAIKNVAIGMSSRDGKGLVHSGGTSTTNIWGGEQDAFLEALPEAVSAVSDYFDNGQNIVYVSVMNRLSVDCDCDGNPAEPDMHDIGVLASHDPVALDQACVDLVYAAPDGDSLIKRMESRNGIHALEHADEIGLGSRAYRLIEVQIGE